jgi:hypothetical protein
MLLRNLVYEDHAAALEKIVPVVLPEGSAKDLPLWLGGSPTGHYAVEGFTVDGALKLLQLLTGQLYETEPPLGPKPALSPREPAAAATPLVLHPPVTASAPAPSPEPPPPAFVMPESKDLIDALMACRKLRQLPYRYELLEMMSESLGEPDYVFDVPESAEARTHLRALDGRIRRTTLMADAVLKVMYLSLKEIAPDDIGTKRVRELLVACGLVLGEA